MKLKLKSLACLMSLSLLAFDAAAQDGGHSRGLSDKLGPRFAPANSDDAPERHSRPSTDDATRRVIYWNEMALRTNALDHTTVAAGELRIYGEQFGPARTSRALAIVQLAVYDAVNAITSTYPSYAGLPQAPADTSVDAAIAQAAHDALAALYPSQASSLDDRLGRDLEHIPEGPAKTSGIDLGRRAAAAILALRANDGAEYPDPVVGVDFIPSNEPGKWRPDPISQIPIAVGARWVEVHPFVLPATAPFQLPPPPPLSSDAYTAAFNEVKRLGGDGVTTPTQRTPEQTVIGIYWSYDGTPRLGTPPRLYNQITAEIAGERTSDALGLARLLALVNVAMADTCMVAWRDKYYAQFWRPVTGVREADEGTGPTGLGDGNPATRGAPGWTPLGAQASNLTGPNFTPPFPSYPSGHATFGSAMFQTLRRFYDTDQIPFSFVSDEYNGVTRDNRGQVRPRLERSFASLSQAEEENGQSRIYLGIHWNFDKTNGMALGRRVADYVYAHGLVRPQP